MSSHWRGILMIMVTNSAFWTSNLVLFPAAMVIPYMFHGYVNYIKIILNTITLSWPVQLLVFDKKSEDVK